MEGLEIDDFEVDDLHNPNNDVEGLEAPSIGMSFETIEEARKYYEDYGRQNGFWIRTRTSSKGKNRSNDVTSMLFVCAKEGNYVAKIEKDGVEGNDEREENDKVILKKRKRSCSTARCGCSAHLRIKLDKWSLKWKVTVFDDAHNHLLVTPSKRMKMKSNRHMPKAVKDLTEALGDFGYCPTLFTALGCILEHWEETCLSTTVNREKKNGVQSMASVGKN